jgi:hypothetical protein
MTAYTKTLAAGIAAILVTTPILAQQQPAPKLSEQCRAEVAKLCGTDRSKLRGCLRENYSKLSGTCLDEVRAAAQNRQQSRQQPRRQEQ